MPAAASSASGLGVSELQALAQHLAALAEGGGRHRAQRLDRHAGRGCSIGVNSTTAEATVGGGVKASGFSVNSRRGRVRHWAMHREAPVGLGAGRGDDALGHLLLEHQHHALVPRRPGLALEPADEQQRGHVVGQVGDDDRLGCGVPAGELRPVGVAARRRSAPRAGPDSARRWPPAPAGSARRAPPRRRARRPPGTARASARRARARPRPPCGPRAGRRRGRCGASG